MYERTDHSILEDERHLDFNFIVHSLCDTFFEFKQKQIPGSLV